MGPDGWEKCLRCNRKAVQGIPATRGLNSAAEPVRVQVNMEQTAVRDMITRLKPKSPWHESAYQKSPSWRIEASNCSAPR